MKKTWVEVLLELPVDAGLRDFLTDNGLTMPAGFTWTDAPETSQALVEALLTCADVTVRDRVAAKFRASVELGDAAGKQAMFQVSTGNAAALSGLVACHSDMHRSFWI